MPKASGDHDDGREKVTWQVIATWKDTAGRGWSDVSEPYTDRAEAWAAFHAAAETRAAGWSSHGGRTAPGPRVGHRVEIHEQRLYRNADGKWRPAGYDRRVETTEADPAERTVDIRGRVAALAGEMRERTREMADRCSGCSKEATDYDTDGRPWCAGHLPRLPVETLEVGS